MYHTKIRVIIDNTLCTRSCHQMYHCLSLGDSDTSGDNYSCRGCYPPNDVDVDDDDDGDDDDDDNDD